MITRLFQAPNTSFFLFGPRGCGKTTWYRNHYKSQSVVFDLLNAELFRELSSNPELLKKRIAADTGHTVFILDEIQRIPELLPVIHSITSEQINLQFILTGSNARNAG
jgi:predicted AAA+ superfamily ATPase